MQSQLSHIQFNVAPENLAFYRDLMSFLGWKTLHDGEGMLGVGDTNRTSLWFVGYVKAVENDYDGPGANHFAIGVKRQADVDAAAAHLTARGVTMLFDTPRHRPDFGMGAGQTYYQIMFETPDRMLLEVVYIGPLAA
ncbi:MAG: VOC family protein [Roseiflexaceae bacterium]|nr:VOC family protein [Roseiflexaceae bacterium]